MDCMERKNIGPDFHLTDNWFGWYPIECTVVRGVCFIFFLGEGSIVDTSGERRGAASAYLGNRRGVG